MIQRRGNKIKCSECSRWFVENDNTLFLKLYSNNRPQNIATFCGPTCKSKFHNKIFKSINNVKETA